MTSGDNMLDLEDIYSNDIGSFVLELYRKALSLREHELHEYFLDHADRSI